MTTLLLYMEVETYSHLQADPCSYSVMFCAGIVNVYINSDEQSYLYLSFASRTMQFPLICAIVAQV